jgi:c-di-GMP-binding flagellar brake protein YcgR
VADPIKGEGCDGPVFPGGAAVHISAAQNPHLRRCLETRQEIDCSVVIRLVNLAADVHGRIVDISLGGCRIRSSRPFPVGIFRRVEVEFRVDGLPFRFAGVTQAIYDPRSVGIRFLDLSERKREQLQQLLEEIGKHEPSPNQEE